MSSKVQAYVTMHIFTLETVCAISFTLLNTNLIQYIRGNRFSFERMVALQLEMKDVIQRSCASLYSYLIDQPLG